jgi:transcriptional regulator with XRE-family HTH domain
LAAIATRTLGDFLREARGDRAALDVVRAGGPAPSNLSAYERDLKLPRPQALKWLCEHYGVDFEQAMRLRSEAQLARDFRAAG